MAVDLRVAHSVRTRAVHETTTWLSDDDIIGTAQFLEAYWRARDDSSFDPYDGLESDRLDFLHRLPRPVQLAVVQLNKRSPVNLRPLEGIRRTRNASCRYSLGSATSRSRR